jgi:CMD domain protein
MTEALAADVINTILGAAPGSRLAELRAQRPEVFRHTQGSHDVLVDPADPGGVSLAERALVALRVAVAGKHPALAAHYREKLRQRAPALIAIADGAPASDRRLAAILAHVERVAAAPGTSTKAHLDTLREAGLSPQDIVTISQIIAFVSYQTRIAHGLAALGQEMGPRETKP